MNPYKQKPIFKIYTCIERVIYNICFKTNTRVYLKASRMPNRHSPLLEVNWNQHNVLGVIILDRFWTAEDQTTIILTK